MGCAQSSPKAPAAVEVPTTASPAAPATPDASPVAVVTENKVEVYSNGRLNDTATAGAQSTSGEGPARARQNSQARPAPALESDITASDGCDSSQINTFDSITQFDRNGLTDNNATTFQRPKTPPSAQPTVEKSHSSGRQKLATAEHKPQAAGGDRGQIQKTRRKSWANVQLENRQSRGVEKPMPQLKGRVTPGPPLPAQAARHERSSGAESSEAAAHHSRTKSWSQVELPEEVRNRPRSHKQGHQRERRKAPQGPNSAPKPENSDGDADQNSWRHRQRRPSQPQLISVERAPKRVPNSDATSVDSSRRSRRGCQPSAPVPSPSQAAEGIARKSPLRTRPSPPRAAEAPGRKSPLKTAPSRRPQVQEKEREREKPRPGRHPTKAKPPAVTSQAGISQQIPRRREAMLHGLDDDNAFAELVDTQASSLDVLVHTATLNKPTLTTVIGNPLASEGSLTEADLHQIDAEMSAAAANGQGDERQKRGAWDWPDAADKFQQASAQAWRPLTSANGLDSDAASDTATMGTQGSASLKGWALQQQQQQQQQQVAGEGNRYEGASDDDVLFTHAVTPEAVDAKEIKLGFDRYDNLGPISDVTTHSIAQGAMRLLRRRANGRLFAGKFIPRPVGGILHKWHERELINHRAVHGHRHVIGFRDVFLTEAHVVIVMDYATCGSLASLLRDRGTLPEAEARRLFTQLIRGLQHCHSRGVFHRNIQLECILMDGNEGSPTLRIGGFSRSKSEEADSQPKSAVGRPSWTPPELLLGMYKMKKLSGHKGAPLDVWAAGVVLFHMLYGCNPFQDPKQREGFTVQMMRRIVNADYKFPRQPPVSAECRDLVQRVLVVDPELRATIPEILAHPWLKRSVREEDAALGADTGVVAAVERSRQRRRACEQETVMQREVDLAFA